MLAEIVPGWWLWTPDDYPHRERAEAAVSRAAELGWPRVVGFKVEGVKHYLRIDGLVCSACDGARRLVFPEGMDAKIEPLQAEWSAEHRRTCPAVAEHCARESAK